jgi:hypothetical protein
MTRRVIASEPTTRSQDVRRGREQQRSRWTAAQGAASRLAPPAAAHWTMACRGAGRARRSRVRVDGRRLLPSEDCDTSGSKPRRTSRFTDAHRVLIVVSVTFSDLPPQIRYTDSENPHFRSPVSVAAAGCRRFPERPCCPSGHRRSPRSGSGTRRRSVTPCILLRRHSAG